MAVKIRVLIVDDQPVVRLGLSEAINGSDGMEVVGAVAPGEDAFELARRVHPDVVIVDLPRPDMAVVETITRLRSILPESQVLMFSAAVGEEDVFRAVDAGVRGYLSKASGMDEVFLAIQRLRGGEEYFPPFLEAKLANRRQRTGLSLRELEVLRHVVAGRSNKEIVGQMRVSEATVKLHLSNMLAKLGVTDRTQAAIAAVQRGIVHLDN